MQSSPLALTYGAQAPHAPTRSCDFVTHGCIIYVWQEYTHQLLASARFPVTRGIEVYFTRVSWRFWNLRRSLKLALAE